VPSLLHARNYFRSRSLMHLLRHFSPEVSLRRQATQLVSETKTLEKVSAFWGTEACGTHFVRDFADERDFYEKFREFR